MEQVPRLSGIKSVFNQDINFLVNPTQYLEIEEVSGAEVSQWIQVFGVSESKELRRNANKCGRNTIYLECVTCNEW
jgi:hypothetical protein